MNGRTSACGADARMVSAALAALSSLRAPTYTMAPCWARARAASRPMPAVAPVISTTLPLAWSAYAAATCSAVEAEPKPEGPLAPVRYAHSDMAAPESSRPRALTRSVKVFSRTF